MDAMPFEPMTVGQILDRTFRLYRKHFVRFLAVVGIVYVPIGLISVLFTTWITMAASGEAGPMTPAVGIMVLIGVLVGAFLALFAQVLANGALLKAVSEAYLGGDATVGESYRAVLPRLLSLVGAGFLIGILFFVGLILCVVPGIIVWLLFALTASVIVVEDAGAFAGMSRSKALVSGNLGKVFAVSFVVFLIAYVVGFAFGAVGGLVAKSMTHQMAAHQFVVQLFQTAGRLLAFPIGAIATILLYYDLRIRKEGFDLEMLAQSMRSELPPPNDV